MLKKFNKYLSIFKIYRNKKKLKWFFINFIQSLKYNDCYFFNKSWFYLINKKIKVKYKINNLLEKKQLRQKNSIKLNFFVNYFYRLFINQYLNYKNKNNIILKYYFYFYNFIIKIFIKMTCFLSNFRFINNKNNQICSNLLSNFQKRYFRQRAHSNPFSDHYLE